MFAVVKLGSRFAQAKVAKSGEETSTTPTVTVPVIGPTSEPPTSTRPKEVVDVEDIPEPTAQKEKETKRKDKAEIGPEKPRKKIRTISLAKKRGDECVTEIHMLPENEPGFCTLHAASTVVEPEAERRIEDLEMEAKMMLPQV